MEEGFQKLRAISHQMKTDRRLGFAPEPPTLTPRKLVSWFGYERRSPWLVERVRRELHSCGLRIEPDFQKAEADDQIAILDSFVPEPPSDNTLRVNSLPAAANVPRSVKPDDDLSKAKTLMASNDFSQVPVMTSTREVKGVITWKSIGSSTRPTGDKVRHFMDDSPQIIDGRRPLFEAVGIISNHGYVLVRGHDNSISGIVTISDINSQLLQLTEAFLLIREIEGHVRTIIHCRFTREEVLSVLPVSKREAVTGIADLSFGDYCRLMESPILWERLSLYDDRATFVQQLHEVREVRNHVMHFNITRHPAKDIQKLRTLAPFFRSRAHPPVA